MALPSLRRILNNTPGSATDIDFNDQTLQTHVNSELIARDGSVAMTAPLVGVPAVASNQYVTLSQVDSGGGEIATVPTGAMMDFGGDTAPAGWALCNGQTQSSTDPLYVGLFAVIGYKYGDPGGGNFTFPDRSGKVSVGVDLGGDTLYDTIGDTGGQRDAELLEHLHDIGHGHANTFATGTTGSTHTHTTTGGNHNHTYSQVTSNNSAVLGGGAFYNNVQTANTGGTGAHTHTVTITGSSHTHNITGQVTDHPGNSGNQGAGTTLVDKNFPPFVVSNVIIKL